jgi:hypothetical protein
MLTDSPPTNPALAAFMTAWPAARQALTSRIAARAADDSLFPRAYAEAQLALLDAAMRQLTTLLRYLAGS